MVRCLQAVKKSSLPEEQKTTAAPRRVKNQVRDTVLALESISHLVQQEDVILKTHAEELTPDEYYDELYYVLLKKYPGADPDLVQHVVSDTAAALGLSFGVAKFQLAHD